VYPSATKRRFLAALFFSWLIALLALTYWPDMPEVEIKKEWFRTDYLGHFGFYALLMLFFLLWHRVRTGGVSKRMLLYAALAGIVLGALTEVTQQFIPGRRLNPFDLMYNCLGIAAGTAVFFLMSKRKLRA
jgi:VanZ family protein